MAKRTRPAAPRAPAAPTPVITAPNAKIELLSEEKLGVAFPYDKFLVAEIRNLSHRRWNPAFKRWEVHFAHLMDLARIFSIDAVAIPADLRERHAREFSDRSLRVELGPLEGRIHGVGAPLEEIDDATSFPMPGHSFSPKFKSGQWDGKRHLFQKQTMKFPSGLWPRIKAILERAAAEFKIEEAVATEPARFEFGAPQSELRPYQSKTLETALERGRGIVQIATGGGKTLVAAHLIRRLGVRALFFVHTRDLLHQTADVFERELGVKIGRLGDGLAELGEVTVATVQTAARALGVGAPRAPRAQDDEEDDAGDDERPTRLNEERKAEIAAWIASASAVIFDECHHVPADTFYKIAFLTPNAARRYGLSATPWRDDGHDLLLEAALGQKICAITCSDLIDAGFLVPPAIEMERPPSHLRLSRRMGYPEIYKAAIVENQARNRAIAARARLWAGEGRPTLILVAHVEHGRALQELLPEANFAYGAMESAERRRCLDELERKLRPILIATTLADEGLDIPALEALILAGGGKSDTKAYQRIGRALRPSPGKAKALVMDFFDAAPYLIEHSLARLALYRQEPRFQVQTKGFQA